jgi:hypothetical protein
MTARVLIVPLLASTALACSHGSAPQAAPAQPPHATAAPPRTASAEGSMCPMDVPGTQLSAADTATGETLTFISTPDQAPALRERVRAMAAMHEERHAMGDGGHMGEGHGGMMHEGTGMGGMERPPPSHAVVEDVENGARVVVTPNDPADLQKLQTTVKAHAQKMQQEGCGMMGHGGSQQ